MKILTFFLASAVALSANIGYTHGTWIPSTAVPTYPIVETPLVPSVTYSTYVVTADIVRYQWMPVYVNKPVVVNNYGLFCRKRQVIYQPQIEWTLQPIYYYR